ncbi:MAG: aldolase [Rhodospirillaceae bacterium]|jgi:ribulose-5-phosphate 4-epimerase/fuculose-1-phosphate aldolase|nr:aldolase [Rhodospirillaceae bacterium]MBT6117187.1 aldolase [Rhodospirillaceae bacterium]
MAVVEKFKSNQDEVWRTRVDLAAAIQIAAMLDMTEGIDNHFTVKVPGRDNQFFVNPKGLHWSEVRASDILICEPDGTVLEGDLPPPVSAVCIHLPIHQAHPRGNVVFHTHMPYSTALSCSKEGRLEMCHQNAVRFWNDVAYDDHFNGLADDPAEGRRMAEVYGDKTVMFLANHGAVTVTETIAESVDHMYFLERACEVQILAESRGKGLHIIPEDVIKSTFEQYGNFKINAARHFEALKRMLEREGSDYAE